MIFQNRITFVLMAFAILRSPVAARAQIADSPDESVAGIPVNYTGANVRHYTLPDSQIDHRRIAIYASTSRICLRRASR